MTSHHGQYVVAIIMGCVTLAAQANTATATMPVTLTLLKSCVATSNGSLAFGNVSALPAVANSTFSVTCTNTTAYSVALSVGGATSGTYNMNGSGNRTLSFSLYRDSANQTLWNSNVSATGNGNAQSYAVYGRVPLVSPLPTPDTYTSTVTATITY